MKKLSVLLVAAAVALSASAGVNYKITNDKKVNAKEVKAKAGIRQSNKINRGSDIAVVGTQLKAMDWQVRPASHMLRGENDITWDFENMDQLADWMVLDNDGDGYNWEYWSNAGLETGLYTTHSGDGVMVSASYVNDPTTGGGTPLTPDNWLISPVMTLGKSVSFWACGQDANYAAEKFGLFVCIGNPENVNDFVQVGATKTATGTMTQYTFDLSEYAGQEGCFAIRHFNVTDMFYLNVDDITMSNDEVVPEPEPETPMVITEIPEGCQIYTYARNSGCIYYSWLFGIGCQATDGDFVVAFDAQNGEVYIQNPSWWHDGNNTWVKGTYTYGEDGVFITIPTGQYLAWYEDYGYGIQLVWGSSYVYTDTDPDTGEEGYYMGTAIDDRTTEINFMLGDDCIYLLGTEGDINAEFPEWGNATGLMTIYSDDQSWTSFEIANRDEYGYELPFGELKVMAQGPTQPQNPTADEWYDCGDESGYSRFYFTLPTKDVNGLFLYPENLSFSIYVDNGNGPEVFTFDEATYYYDIEGMGDMTVIPYEIYSSGYDFHNSYVYFYRTNVEGFEPLFTDNIGIQVYYTVDGVTNASDIVWLYDTHVAVDEVNAGKTVANVRYFNVAGQEMAQPEGMTIQVTTYTDGTKSAVKVVK
ncbi:MAG: choice-of-anchor J domain-containing protein [Bacteroidales bacterium]|nr:choice-of-anchor J domain-containing protein [Bacteroidales bacterium]